MARSGNTDSGTVGGDERIRLFCALCLPGDALDLLERWQVAQPKLEGVRVVPRGNLHVTLAFLGQRPVAELGAITQSLRDAAAGAAPPELAVRRYRETRSVGMLVFDDAEGWAAALAVDLHERLEALGVYEREKRRWLPHVTVLRFRQPPHLHPLLPDLGRVSPSEAAVYHSLLRRGGAQYEALETVRVGGG